MGKKKTNTMKRIKLEKMNLLGKVLLAKLLLFGLLFANAASAQTNDCKADFAIKLDTSSQTVYAHARSNKQPVVFAWKISDGSTYRGERMKHQFTAAGKYTICLVAIAYDSVSNSRCSTRI